MIVVEVQFQALTHGIETVHEMDAIECRDVSVVTISPVTRDFNCFRRIFAELEDFCRTDEMCSYVCKAVPGCVNRWTRWLPVDRFVIGGDRRADKLDSSKRDIGVDYRCY